MTDVGFVGPNIGTMLNIYVTVHNIPTLTRLYHYIFQSSVSPRWHKNDVKNSINQSINPNSQPTSHTIQIKNTRH